MALRDLEAVLRLLTSPALMALFDMPFAPLFLFGIFLFHPWLGYLAIFGGALLIVLTLTNLLATRRSLNRANSAVAHAEILSEQIRSEAEMIEAMGMRASAFARWQKARTASLSEHMTAADLSGVFTTSGKAFRLLLQSAMLGLGAYLVLQNQLTPGAMIAGSILMGRALAPIEMSIGHWPLATFRPRTQGMASLGTIAIRRSPRAFAHAPSAPECSFGSDPSHGCASR